MLTHDNYLDIDRLVRETKKILKPISLHDIILTKCALIFVYYPMKASKLKIFSTLDKKQKIGMLYRHILGVASKIGVYQTIIKEIVRLRQDHVKYKKYLFEYSHVDYWAELYKRNEKELSKQYNMLLDIMIEELKRRHDPKYLRKKKLNEIKENLQN